MIRFGANPKKHHMSYKLIDAPLLTADQIRTRVYELAQAIESTTSEPLHLIAVLKGSIVFLADLIRAMRGPITLDFIAVSSYDANVSSGAVHLLKDIDTNIKDQSVVIIEDIVDTGLTLEYIQTLLRSKKPKTLQSVCLLSKPSRRQTKVVVDHVGFEIEDHFVVGYGLDYEQQHRHLPHISILEVTSEQ